MKTLYESILSSTKTGKNSFKQKIEEWLKLNKINKYTIDDDNMISVEGYSGYYQPYTITTDIPDYIKFDYLSILLVNKPEILKIIPNSSSRLIFEDIDIDDFSFLEKMQSCKCIEVHNCNIKSLKGLNKIKDLKIIIFSGNKKIYTIKELYKASGLKPSNIRNIGSYSGLYNSYVLNDYECPQIANQLENIIKKVEKEVPEIKFSTISHFKKGDSGVYLSFDFLEKEKIPYKIALNGVYLNFKYSIDESKIELFSNGHIEITPEEKQTPRYKYHALKSLLDPYLDNGGKKFRKTQIKEFYSDEMADKIIPFIKDVIKAALENQGGEIKRD